MVSSFKNITFTLSFRWIEIGSLLVFILFTILFTWKIGVALSGYPVWLVWVMLFPAWILGWLAADFASGMVHFLCDNFGSADTPVVGKALIRPFREHHDLPHDMVKHDLVETNGNNCMVCLPFLIPAYFFLPLGSVGALFVAGVLLFFFYGIGLTNQFHKWAHDIQAPPLARLLQRWRLALPPLQHGFHHAPPFKNYYCITCGWLNGPLERVRFFERLENRLRRI